MQAKKIEFQKNEIVNGENRTYCFMDLVGLSTDAKPAVFQGNYLQEGSTFFEENTSKAFMLKADGNWAEI